MTDNYTQNAIDLLARFGVTFVAALVGCDCPDSCEDKREGYRMWEVGTYPRNSHIHGKHYRATFTRPCMDMTRNTSARHALRTEVYFDFWNSYMNEEYNYIRTQKDNFNIPDSMFKKHGVKRDSIWGRGKTARTPTAYDVLACLTKTSPGTFTDFCGEYGYDSDSRRAENTYHAVVEEYGKLSAFFTTAELEALQEVQ